MSNSSDDSFEDVPLDFLSKVKTDNKYNSADDDHPEENDPETDKAIGGALEDRRKYISRECMEARKSLDFGSSDINDLDCVTISMYLVEKHTNLKILHLGSNHIEDEGLIDILSGLQWHTQLRELYLESIFITWCDKMIGNNPFSSLGVNALIDTLPLFEHLEILSLCNIGMDDELAVLFCDAISELNNLNTLFLNTNDIGDDTFLTLSILFSSKKLPIRILHLGETLPTSQGLVPFLKALQTNDTLKHLYLNDIKFDNEAVNSLNKLLMRNEALEHINLGNCNIDDEGVNVFKDGISSNSTLQYLHLWSNKITDEGAQTLLEVLQEDNDALLGLSLFGNPIKHDDIIDEIKELLKQNAGFMQVALREKDLIMNGNENRIDGKEDEEEYEEDFEDVEGDDDKENKADEQELEEIEKEIEDTERELFEEKMHRRALKEKEKQLKVKEKVWQGFSKPTGGMMHSSFKEK